MAPTPLRQVRVADEIWNPARDLAHARGDNLSEIIRRALTDYVKDNQE